MTKPDERTDQVEQLKRETDALQGAMLSSAPPPQATISAQSEDTWSRDAKKMLDLTDAYSAGFTSPERQQLRSMEDIAERFDQYEDHMARFLSRVQNLLIEAIEHIEALEKRWNRLT